MHLAKGTSPRTALSRLALILIGSSLLVGCQSLGWGSRSEVRTEARAEGWRVVERVGDARYLAPEASGWAPAMPATTLPSGSQVVTGAGGRVILARAGVHVSAGPASQFSLPHPGPGAVLEQAAGSLRYRLAEAATAPRLLVETPFLAIEVRGTVFAVTVSKTATEVAVEQGQLRIATPDGLRQIELAAGQSAYASGGAGGGLAFRRGHGQPLEQVEPLILPAMQPKAGALQGPRLAVPLVLGGGAASRASTSGTASSVAVVPIATADASANAPNHGAGTGAIGSGRPAGDAQDPSVAGAHAGRVPRSRAAPDGANEAAGSAGSSGHVASEAPAAARAGAPAREPVTGHSTPAGRASGETRSPFDRLTAGMVDAVPAARRRQEPPVHVPSI